MKIVQAVVLKKNLRVVKGCFVEVWNVCEFKDFGFAFYEDRDKCWRKVAGTIRSFVNARDLDLNVQTSAFAYFSP